MSDQAAPSVSSPNGHHHVLEPDAHIDAGLEMRPRKASQNINSIKASLAECMARRPATTAVVAVLVGALASEALALFFNKQRTRTALRRSARANLRLAHDIDPDNELLD